MFERVRNLFARSKVSGGNKVAVNLLDVWKANRPLTAIDDIAAFNNDGYRRNSVIFACISIRATSFMGPGLQAFAESGDEEELLPEGHALSRLLAYGYGRDSQSTFMRKWSTCLDVAGNAYALKVRSRAGVPVALRLLRPDCVFPVVDSYGQMVAYEYGKNKTSRIYTAQEIEQGVEGKGHQPALIPARDVVHEMGHPDILNPYQGLSPIAVLARMGDLDNYAVDFLRAFFLNSGIPSGILKYKVQLTPEQRRQAYEKWKEQYSLRTWSNTSTGGAFNLAVMDEDADYKEIGSKLKMMDLGQVFGETETRICSVFGVPPIIAATWIGLQHATKANYEEAMRHFYKTTMLPVWISTADRFSRDIAQEFGDNLYCKFDLSSVEELQKDQREDKRLALEAWNKALLTRNEARSAWGLDPDADGDVYKASMADNFVPAGLNPEDIAIDRGDEDEEQMLLTGGLEKQAARLEPWRQIQSIADTSAPAVKKKYSRR